MKCSVKPYNGDKPYIFLSYCHEDEEKVYPIIERMAHDGYRIWYDEGINPGSDWPEVIAEKLKGSKIMICCMSKAASKSHNCRNELTFALEDKKIVTAVMLEKFILPLGLRLQLASSQRVDMYDYPEDKFYEKLYTCKDLHMCLGSGQEYYDKNAEEDVKAEEEERKAAEAQAKAQAEAEAQAKAQAEAEARAKAQAEAEAQAKAQAEAEAQAKAQAEAEAQAKAQAEAEAQAKAQAEAEAQAKAQAEAEAKAEVKTDESRDDLEKIKARAKAQIEAAEAMIREAEAKANAAAAEKAADDSSEIVLKKPSEIKAAIEDVKGSVHFDAYEGYRGTAGKVCEPDDDPVTMMETDDDVRTVMDIDDDTSNTVIIDPDESDPVRRDIKVPVMIHLGTGTMYTCVYPETIVGRNRINCDIVLGSLETISDKHLKIMIYNGKNYISDVNSSNGTYYKGRRLGANEEVEVSDFAEVRLAKEDFVIAFGSKAESIRKNGMLAALESCDTNETVFLFGDRLDLGRKFRWTGGAFGSDKISREHAYLEYKDGEYSITDTSSNGTYINGSKDRIGKNNSVVLKNDDVIRMGSEKFIYKQWVFGE